VSHGLVDNRNPRSIGPISDRENTASEQRRPDGLEEIRVDLVSSEPEALGNGSVVSFGSEELFPRIVDEQIANDASALHTGNRENLLKDAAVQIAPLRGDVDARRCRESHRKDPLGPESRIDAHHVAPAPNEQTGTDEQNDRKRELRHHERTADSAGGRSARDTSATFLTGGT